MLCKHNIGIATGDGSTDCIGFRKITKHEITIRHAILSDLAHSQCHIRRALFHIIFANPPLMITDVCDKASR